VTYTNAILMWTGALLLEPEPYWEVLVSRKRRLALARAYE
jgi:hypothetical protein